MSLRALLFLPGTCAVRRIVLVLFRECGEPPSLKILLLKNLYSGKFSDRIFGMRIFDSQKRISALQFFVQSLREMYTYRFALVNFISSTLSARYRRSFLGFLWSLLNPLLTMLIMGGVFSTLFKQPFSEFSLYLFSGLLPWNMVSSSLLIGGSSIVTAEGYLKKIYSPKVMYPIAAVGVEVVNFVLSLFGLFILALLWGAKLSWALFLLPLALTLLALFILGLVFTLSIAVVYFRDLTHIIQILLMGLFYLTPIMYPVDFLSGQLLTLIKFNPFYYFIQLFHTIIFQHSVPDLSNWLVCLLLGFLSFVVGVFVFAAKDKDVIYRL